jgi:hypothetical protein
LETRFSRAVARVAWAAPVLLLALTINQFKVARDLSKTLSEGESAVAEITRYFRSDRKDVTFAELDLRIVLADGTTMTREHLALPYSIAHRVDQADSVAVRVLPGAAQEVVIEAIGGTQSRIALSNAAMSLIVFLLALAGVWFWNRWVSRAAVQ